MPMPQEEILTGMEIQTPSGEILNKPSVPTPSVIPASTVQAATAGGTGMSLQEQLNQRKAALGLPALQSQGQEMFKQLLALKTGGMQGIANEEGRVGALAPAIGARQERIQKDVAFQMQPLADAYQANQAAIQSANTQLGQEMQMVQADREWQRKVLDDAISFAQQGFENDIAIYNAVAKIPVGQSVAIGGKTYEGMYSASPDVYTVREEDAAGNVVIVGLDKNTGEELYRNSLGKIGTGLKGGGGSNDSTFTDTQSNKGAATAGIPIADFGKLDEDTKNFFINNSEQINSRKKLIDKAKENKEDPASIEKEISQSALPGPVKDTLVRYLWTVFPRPTSQASKPWWKIW